ncbi:MAG: putative motility protein [Planctomycetaceae bacterium]|jgi:hypothetical protein|nr:putative motility protein [Planctomycetaceae bacterium]
MDPLISNAVLQQQQQTQLQVQMSVMKKTLDTQKMLGEVVLGLLEGASLATPGKSVDSGHNFDAYA